jgi:hypothetical protein
MATSFISLITHLWIDNSIVQMLTVLGPQAHILVGGNIRDNAAELLKVCGDIRNSTAEASSAVLGPTQLLLSLYSAVYRRLLPPKSLYNCPVLSTLVISLVVSALLNSQYTLSFT